MSDGWYGEEEVGSKRRRGDDFSDNDDNAPTGNTAIDGMIDDEINKIDFLRYESVSEVSILFRTTELRTMFERMSEYMNEGMQAKNALSRDDEEYHFVLNCSKMVMKMEVEKTKVHKFIRDHYARRFLELDMLCADAVTYAKLVKLISNDMNLAGIIDEMDELVPSQVSCAIIACASTTDGQALDEVQLTRVVEACDELIGIEEAKQALLEYIQMRMILICRNLCAFLGGGIASQMFALAGSMDALAALDPEDLINLGKNRASTTGFAIETTGFLINVDLIACQPPELRTKALRLVSQTVIDVARVDANRRAADESFGLKCREEVKRKMLSWTDPLVQETQAKNRWLANKLYERRNRKGAAERAEAGMARKFISRSIHAAF